ncbi:cytochrome P450 [Mycena vulgaris]|nr:cytochrome P450 [Mycena vulgaris]
MWSAVLGFAVLFGVSRVYTRYVAALNLHNHLPGFRPVFDPQSPIGSLIPTYWWNPGYLWPWIWRKTAYFNHQHDVISMVPLLFGRPCYYIGSVEVMKQLFGQEGKVELVKPLELTTAKIWGDSIASSSGEMWKRHRRIVGPAFNARNYSLVAAESIGTYKTMSSVEGWESEEEILIPEINPIILRFTFIIMAKCGFGLPVSWITRNDNSATAALEDALSIASKTLIPRFILPRWAYYLPIKKLHEIDRAWNSVIHLMGKLVLTRKEDLSLENETDQNNDIFSRLVNASDGSAKYTLDGDEVTANMLSIMFAGNETSASVLVTTLVCLALYQDEQDKAFAEIQHIIPPGREPELDDVKIFVHISACMQEAQRLIPALLLMPRDVMENVTVKVTHPAEGFVTFQKGARVVVDDIAIHHNPNYFPEPDKYLPSRWYGRPEYDNPEFGFGPRACIGRKFAQIESTLFLCLLLRDWKLDIVLKDGETVIEYEERVLGNASLVGTAFGLGPVPLKLSRRH